MEADGQTRIGVHGLDDLGSLVVDHPVRVDLGVAVGVQHNSLVRPNQTQNYFKFFCHLKYCLPEVCGVDPGVVGAVVEEVDGAVHIGILLTDVTPAVAVGVHLLRVVRQPAVVTNIRDAIVISI